MLKIHHTEWPVGRKPTSNEIKSGGLWYRDQQEQLLNQAKRLVRREQEIRHAKFRPVDEIKTFARWFWAVFAIASLIIFFFLNRH